MAQRVSQLPDIAMVPGASPDPRDNCWNNASVDLDLLANGTHSLADDLRSLLLANLGR